MAKFFSKKGNDKGHLSHSQVVGIAWLSALLLLIAGLIIFLPRKGETGGEKESPTVADTAILTQKEDSAYRQRRNFVRNEQRMRQEASATTERFDTLRPIKRQPLTVELNSADTLTLQMLHGIGPARARRITAYRERLGGFRKVEQLAEVYGIEPQLVAELAPHLTIDTAEIRKISINTIELKQLLKHPYIEYYQARDIIRLRSKGQRFTTADDLRAVPSMADSTLERLLPYIDFGIQ